MGFIRLFRVKGLNTTLTFSLVLREKKDLDNCDSYFVRMSKTLGCVSLFNGCFPPFVSVLYVVFSLVYNQRSKPGDREIGLET